MSGFNLTSSSTNRSWRALPDRVLSQAGLSVVSRCWMFGGERSSVPFLSQNPLTHGSLSPFLGLLLGLLPLLFSRPLALTPRTRKWKSSN